MRRPGRFVGLALCFAILVGLSGLHFLTQSNPGYVGAPPPDVGAEIVRIVSPSGNEIAGWYSATANARGAVLLVHGVRANRKSQIDRMRLFQAEGYSVLAIDLQAHGESPGSHITFGHLESRDVIAAADWLRARLPQQKIAVIGMSLGGASVLLAGEKLKADVLVLEAVYGDIETATSNRLRRYLGAAGSYVTPLLVRSIEFWLGISRKDLRPAEVVKNNHIPKLIIAGSADVSATPEESRRIHENSPEPKAFWLVDGAGHQDFYRFVPAEYRKHVLPFLEMYLRKSVSNPSSN
jgi:uncharacterized protein